jgi:hypothetical protein
VNVGISCLLDFFGVKNGREIDPYTCALIDGLAQMENLPITIHQVDLRDPMPKNIPDNFDLFVADPDFTIPAFALFASRGLSKLRVGGTGLINFENKGGQKFKAECFLEKINAEIVESDKEPWSYIIIRNQQISRGSYYGKYTYVDYEDDLVLSHAAYSSVMFVIKRGSMTEVPLLSHHRLESPAKSIYDL